MGLTLTNINNVGTFCEVTPQLVENDPLIKLLEGQLKVKQGMSEKDYLDIIGKWLAEKTDPVEKKLLMEKMKKIISRHYSYERIRQAKIQLTYSRLTISCLKNKDRLSYFQEKLKKLSRIIKQILPERKEMISIYNSAYVKLEESLA